MYHDQYQLLSTHRDCHYRKGRKESQRTMSWFQLIKRRVLTSSSQNPALRTLFTPIVNGSRIIHFNWSNKPHIEVSKNTTKEMNGSRMFFEAFAGVKLSPRSFHYRLKSSSAMPDVILSEKDRITDHNKEVDFSRPEIIYEKKRTAELLRGLLILQLSSFDAFVQNSMKVSFIICKYELLEQNPNV